jgi:hypothetical protein
MQRRACGGDKETSESVCRCHTSGVRWAKTADRKWTASCRGRHAECGVGRCISSISISSALAPITLSCRRSKEFNLSQMKSSLTQQSYPRRPSGFECRTYDDRRLRNANRSLPPTTIGRSRQKPHGTPDSRPSGRSPEHNLPLSHAARCFTPIAPHASQSSPKSANLGHKGPSYADLDFKRLSDLPSSPRESRICSHLGQMTMRLVPREHTLNLTLIRPSGPRSRALLRIRSSFSRLC